MKLRLPSLITIDAYNTLYTPHASIPIQYNEITSKFGVSLPINQLKLKYGQAYKQINSQFSNYGKAAGLSVDQFWYKVLSSLYSDFHNRLDSMQFDAMVNNIITAFKKKEAYKVFDDFVDVAHWAVKEKQIPFCLASNADAGVTHLVIDEFGMRPFLSKNDVYLSYDVEYCKPDPRFFEYIIEDRLKLQGMTKDSASYAQKRAELIQFSWHLGDEYDKDVETTLKMGMGAILVDRDYSSGFLKANETVKQLGEKCYVVNSLTEVRDLFK
ncbi:hypothetical protein FOA43_001128 [Brettanomyces nanus]|uniref:Haloacid dehalogenase-like hydrolase n=1 Tax=Eeniella nana TaxID=13502 RepID=A0A875S3C6_EENNA|nr:uncharacterized protein FOA43_001128 [Brettanomyces nanus]QPG73814.1 hypothetical protein FOA43_001128 [Brettanomyces nanus]